MQAVRIPAHMQRNDLNGEGGESARKVNHVGCSAHQTLGPTGNGNLGRPLRSTVKHALLDRFHMSRVAFLVDTKHRSVTRYQAIIDNVSANNKQ